MSRLFCIPVVILVLACYTEIVIAGWAKCWNGKRSKELEFGCYGVNKFRDLDKAPNNINSIVYHTSVLPNVEGNVFFRFFNSLRYLDLHKCQIETIDPRAFNHLINLKNLTLWGNKLTMVSADWFSDLTQLKTLDLSFNYISYIDEMAFTRMPRLENFFIDYNHMNALNWNVFTYLNNLKRARIGKNPWDWWFRAMISRQLNDQHVDYTSEWDDYDWINHVIWDCVEKHQARNDDGSVFDCASTYLLRERSKLSGALYKVISCNDEARDLYECTTRTSSSVNVTVTPKLAVRRILEGFVGAFKSMQDPDMVFAYRYNN